MSLLGGAFSIAICEGDGVTRIRLWRLGGYGDVLEVKLADDARLLCCEGKK